MASKISEKPRLARARGRPCRRTDHREAVQPQPAFSHRVRRTRTLSTLGPGAAAVILMFGVAWMLLQPGSTSGSLPSVHSSSLEGSPPVASGRNPGDAAPSAEAFSPGVQQEEGTKAADTTAAPVLPTHAPDRDGAGMPMQDAAQDAPPAGGMDGREASASASSTEGQADAAESSARASAPSETAALPATAAAAAAPAVKSQSLVIYYLLGIRDAERRARQLATLMEPAFGHIEIDAVPHAAGIARVRFSSTADKAVAQKVGQAFAGMGYPWRLIRLSGADAKPRPGRIDAWIPNW